MERLPSLLMSTIENACEQFRNITFTVHGENDRARISIMFTNEDSNKSKRKSNSTVNRDKKRMKEYNNSVESVSNNENNLAVIHSDCAFESNIIQDETVAINTSDIMDIEDNPSEASATACTGNIETGIERPNIEQCSIDTGKELSVSFNSVNRKIDNNVNKNKRGLSIDKIEKNNGTTKGDDVLSEFTFSKANNSDSLSTTSKCVQSCDRLKENNDKSKQIVPSKPATDDIKLIPKFVLKQTGGRNEMLIGKTLRNRLILFHMYDKEFKVIDCSDRGYYKFNKILTEDFRDVRTITKLMTDDVRQGLDLMIEFATNKKL
ncbi:unnamed protein product [Mytilus coruscus]|uniref:Uncharacterized protein n=1 Tax=Mytilus coruscus TaxID=42192 RepID=A0A6J8DF38_MYTCO|nr:unnamed protein product [Mytilus coruscus]